MYREWIPNATSAHLVGDFNNWSRTSHPMERNTFGVWELFLPDKADGSLAIPHNTKVKVDLSGCYGFNFSTMKLLDQLAYSYWRTIGAYTGVD